MQGREALLYIREWILEHSLAPDLQRSRTAGDGLDQTSQANDTATKVPGTSSDYSATTLRSRSKCIAWDRL